MDGRLTTIMFCGAAVLLFYIVALGLIGADLWSGVRKAKLRGEMRTSEAYKRTIDKVSRYFSMLFALTLIDAVQVGLLYFLFYFYEKDWVMFPWFSLLGVAYISFVEVKSIMEPANVKEKKQQQDFKRLLLELAENGNIQDKLMALIKEAHVDGNVLAVSEKGGAS